MLADFIESKQLVCHSDNDDCSLVDIQCSQMNNCNGQGQCANGFCECDPGFTSADCSATLVPLVDAYDETFTSTGIEWFYFEYQEDLTAGDSYVLELISEGPNMDVYVSSSNPSYYPTQYYSDMSFKNQQTLSLSSSMLNIEKFQIMVRIHAVVYEENNFQQNDLQVKFTITPGNNQILS